MATLPELKLVMMIVRTMTTTMVMTILTVLKRVNPS